MNVDYHVVIDSYSGKVGLLQSIPTAEAIDIVTAERMHRTLGRAIKKAKSMKMHLESHPLND